MDDNCAPYHMGNKIQVDSKPCLKQIQVHDVELTVELDCGACTNVNSEQDYQNLTKHRLLQRTDHILCIANGNYLNVLGVVDLKVRMKDRRAMLQFFVVKNSIKYVILGRTGLNVLWANWRNTFETSYEVKNNNIILEVNNTACI